MKLHRPNRSSCWHARPAATAAAALLTGLAVGAGSIASADGADVTYRACVNDTTRVVRIIDPAMPGYKGHCITQAGPLRETAMSWNQTGPAGSAGANGADGATGPAGPAG
ncbi:MAG: hypothetical protein WAS51_17545, partial [Ilumatobacteraceae bacterium]